GKLRDLHERIMASGRSVLCAGLADDTDGLSQLLQMPARVQATRPAPRAHMTMPLPPENIALVVSSQVNHCVIAWSAPNMRDPDAAALAVAAELISNQILHQSLREKGGAYGGAAVYSEEAGIFTMSSFRDPRLAETYQDFHAAVDQILTDDFSEEALEEAIICVIKRLDKPLSPRAQAMEAWNLYQRGGSQVLRQQFRSAVLECKLAHVKVAVQRWLKNGIASRAAATGKVDQDLAGLGPLDLLELAG
ncbi:insulinase family protein, partial [Undibacterium sp.]|uniref:insulinase family protein n=1 Tax=Undibacterium sp. TaxID=1914977 RepID=UPI002C60CAAD